MVVSLGDNDVDNGRKPDAMIGDLMHLFDGFTATGHRMVICTVIPRLGPTPGHGNSGRVHFAVHPHYTEKAIMMNNKLAEAMAHLGRRHQLCCLHKTFVRRGDLMPVLFHRDGIHLSQWGYEHVQGVLAKTIERLL